MLVSLRETTDEKIVLVSNYTSTLDLLQNMLSGKGYSFLRLDGSTPTGKRQDLVDKFNRVDSEAACMNPPYLAILILTPRNKSHFFCLQNLGVQESI